MSNLVRIDEAREKFLADRKGYMGASDDPALFPEYSKWACPYRLFCDKTNVPPDYERTDDDELILLRGTWMEPTVVECFTYRTKLKVRKCKARVSKEHPCMRVNMDRQIVKATKADLIALWPDHDCLQSLPDDPGPGYLECKTAREQMFRKMQKPAEEGGGLPADYIIQTQAGLAVTDYLWGVFAVLEPGSFQLVTFPFIRQENLIAEIIRRSEDFWLNNVTRRKPPETLSRPDDRCKSCQWRVTCPLVQGMVEQIPSAIKDAVVDESLGELAVEIYDLERQAETISDKIEPLREDMRNKMGNRELVVCPSVRREIQFPFRQPSTRWDSDALTATNQKNPDDTPDTAHKFRGCRRQYAPARPLSIKEMRD